MKVENTTVNRASRGRVTLPAGHVRALGATAGQTVRVYRRGTAKFLTVEASAKKVSGVKPENVHYLTVDRYENVTLSDGIIGCLEGETFSVKHNPKAKRVELRTA